MQRKLIFLTVLLLLIPIGCLGRRRKNKAHRRKDMTNFRKTMRVIRNKLREDRQIDQANSNGKKGKEAQGNDGKIDAESRDDAKKPTVASGKPNTGPNDVLHSVGAKKLTEEGGSTGNKATGRGGTRAQKGQNDKGKPKGKADQSNSKPLKDKHVGKGQKAEDKTDSKETTMVTPKNTNASEDVSKHEDSMNVTRVHPHITAEEQARYLQEFRRHIQMKLQLDENMTSEEIPGDLLLPPPLQATPEAMQQDEAIQDNGFHAEPNSYVWAKDVSAECADELNFACLGFENLKALKGQGRVYSAKLWFHGGFSVKRSMSLYSLKKVRSKEDNSTKIWKQHRYLGHVIFSQEKTFKDVTHVVQRWMETTRHNHGFGLVLRREKNSTLPVSLLHPDLFSNESKTPFLELDIANIQSVEKNPICTPDETRCCRNVVRIKGHDIFPQIIAPDEFEVTFCSGICNDPVMDDISSNYTRYIRTFRWKTEEEVLQRGLTPCCAPIKFRSGSILLYKGGTINQYNIPDFMPTACGCI